MSKSAYDAPHLKAAVLSRLSEAEATAAHARQALCAAERRPFHLGLDSARHKAARAEQRLAEAEAQYRVVFNRDRAPLLYAA